MHVRRDRHLDKGVVCARRGVWEAEGVPDATIREFSTRRGEVEAALAELSEALGRPLLPPDTGPAVLATCAGKARIPVEGLRAGWVRRPRETGFGRLALAACFDRRTAALSFERLPQRLEDELAVWLDDAVVAVSPTFARGEVKAARGPEVPVRRLWVGR